MALILLEGLDRTGKSTVASYFKEYEGYEVIHLSAPPKGMSGDQYLQEMVDIVSSAATRDIVLDRTHYGELVWPVVFGRKPLLSEEDIEVLREIESSVGVRRILMHDSDVDAHWKRCVENNEPINKVQFVRARSLYYQMAHKYGFEQITLPQFIKKFPDAAKFSNHQAPPLEDKVETKNTAIVEPVEATHHKRALEKTPEQLKLEKANAINDILSRKILKVKGPIYDELEIEIRNFLNQKLSSLFGGSSNQDLTFTPEEIKFYKTMYKRAIEKGEN